PPWPTLDPIAPAKAAANVNTPMAIAVKRMRTVISSPVQAGSRAGAPADGSGAASGRLVPKPSVCGIPIYWLQSTAPRNGVAIYAGLSSGLRELGDRARGADARASRAQHRAIPVPAGQGRPGAHPRGRSPGGDVADCRARIEGVPQAGDRGLQDPLPDGSGLASARLQSIPQEPDGAGLGDRAGAPAR